MTAEECNCLESELKMVSDLDLRRRIGARRRALCAVVGIAATAGVLTIALAQRGTAATPGQEPGANVTAAEEAGSGSHSGRRVTLVADDELSTSELYHVLEQAHRSPAETFSTPELDGYRGSGSDGGEV